MKEVIPGYYLCKIGNGVAYYLVDKGLYDTEEIATERGDVSLRLMNLIHLLTQQVYGTQFYRIQLVNWENIPKTYQIDAIALNPSIRKERGGEFQHVHPYDMVDLRTKLFSAVDSATGKLKTYKWKGEVSGGGNYLLHEDAPNPRTFTDNSGSMLPKHLEASMPISGLPYSQTNTNPSQMNLLNNIPGLDLSYSKLEKGKLALTMDGQVAYKDKNGSYSYIRHDGADKTKVEVGNLKFDVDFYVMPSQEVVPGDIVLQDGDILLVDTKKGGDVGFVNPITGGRSTKLKRDNIIGMYFYKKIVSIFNMMGDGKANGIGLSGMNPMTLALMSGQMGAGGGTDMTQFMLMSQLTQGGNEMNPMLMMMLMNNQGGDQPNGAQNGGFDMMQFMVMSQAFGGGKGIGNALGGLFGGKPAAKPKKAPVAKKAVAKKAAPKKVAKG